MIRIAAAAARGAVAGVCGTVAMTLLMRRTFDRALPPRARRGFLPEDVVKGAERRLTGRLRLTERSRRPLTLVGHYTYGAGAGVGYGMLRHRMPRAHPALLGAVWGAGVWAASYQGWLPAVGIVPPTTSRPPRKWIVPVGAHLVYGVATAYAHEALSAEPWGTYVCPVLAPVDGFEQGLEHTR